MTIPDKLMLSLRLRCSGAVPLPNVVATFHDWIRTHALDEVLVDVADYSHVPGGPGVVLIGNDYTYSVAPCGPGAPDVHELELACFCKRKTSGQNPLLKTLRRLLEACQLLQQSLTECTLEPSSATIRVSVFDRKATDHEPFRTAEFAWFVAEHLAAVSGARPQITIASDTARPTVHAAWPTSKALGSLLEQLQAHDARGANGANGAARINDSAARAPEIGRNP